MKKHTPLVIIIMLLACISIIIYIENKSIKNIKSENDLIKIKLDSTGKVLRKIKHERDILSMQIKEIGGWFSKCEYKDTLLTSGLSKVLSSVHLSTCTNHDYVPESLIKIAETPTVLLLGTNTVIVNGILYDDSHVIMTECDYNKINKNK